jgi:hypothetical protein
MDDSGHTRPQPVSAVQDGRTARLAALPDSGGRPVPSARRVLVVPVKSGPNDCMVLRTGRLASGEPTGLAFTTEGSLVRALGPKQRWTLLSEPALRALLSPLGVDQIRVDPGIAPAIRTTAA